MDLLRQGKSMKSALQSAAFDAALSMTAVKNAIHCLGQVRFFQLHPCHCASRSSCLAHYGESGQQVQAASVWRGTVIIDACTNAVSGPCQQCCQLLDTDWDCSIGRQSQMLNHTPASSRDGACLLYEIFSCKQSYRGLLMQSMKNRMCGVVSATNTCLSAATPTVP